MFNNYNTHNIITCAEYLDTTEGARRTPKSDIAADNLVIGNITCHLSIYLQFIHKHRTLMFYTCNLDLGLNFDNIRRFLIYVHVL